MTDVRKQVAAPTATDKAGLITFAWNTLTEAHAIDERETLTVEEWVPWYDKTMPVVTDTRVLAEAMLREMEIRRGEKVMQDDVTQCVTPKQAGNPLPLKKRVDRSRDRLLAKAAPQVRKWVKDEAAAGRKPSRRGALKVAKRHLKPVEKPKVKAPEDRVARAVTVADKLVGLIEANDGKPMTHQLLTAYPELQLAAVLIPWVSTVDGVTFTIDHQLRADIETWRRHPTLEGRTVAEEFHRLLAAHRPVREHYEAEKRKSRWGNSRSLSHALMQEITILDKGLVHLATILHAPFPSWENQTALNGETEAPQNEEK